MGVRSSDGYLGIGKQTTKGTSVAPTKFLRLAAAESVVQNQEVSEIRTLNGDEELDAIYKTGHAPDGGFQTFARPDLGAFLLAMILGADSISGVEAPYTHTITRANTIPWLSIERKLTDAERISDCKLNQLVISGESGNPVLIDCSFFGIDSTIESAASPSYETNEPFMFFDTGSYTLDSGAVTTVNSFTITINRNLEKIKTTSYKIDDILETAFDIEVAMRLKYEDNAKYKDILFAGGSALTDVLDDGDLTIDLTYGSGADLKEFKIEIPALKHLGAEKHLDPEPKAVFLDIKSKAVKSASEIITVTCQNAVAAAYI